ncbi:MAG: hypothetical protein ACXAC5_16295 [Promethearchaeota archaeon]|jgi:hypothetical protein
MKVNSKLDEILEDNLIRELEWLKTELELLFKSKKNKYTEKDQKIANAILDYFLENTYVGDNIILLNLLSERVENIENSYMNLF